MTTVLEWIGFDPRAVRGDQLRGPCPVHGSQSPRSRTFSVYVRRGVCFGHQCGFAGNQIQLWGRLKGLRAYEAAIDVCRQAGVEVPWIQRW